jgi:four helix bundle protein
MLMATVRGFENLDAWRMARKLANEIYASSSSGAFARDFALRDQVRDAAVSVISNIAEGFERGGNAEFIQFLSIAKGSVGEVRAQVYIALDQGYIDRSRFEQLQTLASDVGKKIGGLIAYLKKSGLKGSKYKGREPETRNPKPESREAGFSIVTAIFLLVVLSLLGAFIVSVTGLQQSSQQLDVQGVRAYQAARAGIEWAAWQVLDPNNDLPGVGGDPNNLPPCPGPTTNLSSLAQSLSPFIVTVTCSATTTTEGNRNVAAYLIVATACNQPSAGACPNASPASGYVERQVQATLSKCKDPTAAGPRFACG